MSKWCGMVGYGETKEVRPGVYDEQIVERKYYGDVLRNTASMEAVSSINSNINVNNTISIVSDAYAYQNFHLMKYVTYMGTRWDVKSVEVGHPRLSLSIGGVYNGPTPEPPVESGENPGD